MLFIEHAFAHVLFVHGAVQTWQSPGVWFYACMDVRVCEIDCVCADECQQRFVEYIPSDWVACGSGNSSTIIAYFHGSLGATISLAIAQASVMCLCTVRGCDLQETAAMHCCGARVDLSHFSLDI